MFAKVLIANRGEIARRVIRTCRRLGIGTVAVFSDADAEALHVRDADEAWRLGPAAARESYLDIDRLPAAARTSGAEAVHPGYGFLSESAEFAARCAAAGLVFIGPSVEALRTMGSKSAAKALMQHSGVPVLPGYHGDDQSEATLSGEAERLGYPLLIKAVAGGGGRGMRIVEQAAGFCRELESCRREALSGFGDPRVLLERYLAAPRHVEVQVFGDRHGSVRSLFERDCSVQRRHQKILEEAPAPQLASDTRAELAVAARCAAAAVQYVGAGTVEFLLDEQQRFYFMEMNTRIQVEHPVTEMITGLDLVEWQLRVAAGEPLPTSWGAVAPHGHAIEVRLNAELPEAGFLPSGGVLTRVTLPAERPGWRVENGVQAGDTVGIDYDGLLAKLIAWAPDREQALVAMRAMLECVRIEGVGHNAALLRRLVQHPAFRRGGVDTGFLQRELGALTGHESSPSFAAVAAAALSRSQRPPADARSPWTLADDWRLAGGCRQQLLFAGADAPLAVTLVREGGRIDVTALGQTHTADWLPLGGDTYDLRLGDTVQRALLSERDGIIEVAIDGRHFRLQRYRAVREATERGDALVAPMPGRILSLLVTGGAHVTRGQPLLVMEAMKMEHTLCAPGDGRVRGYHVEAGAQVVEGVTLVDFEAAP